MTSGTTLHEPSRHTLPHGFSAVPVVKNVDRYQRSWKLDVGFQKLQKRITERIKRENTLPPLTLGLSRHLHTSQGRSKHYHGGDTHAQKTSRNTFRGGYKHSHLMTPKSKSEQSYSVRLYKQSNNGTTRLANKTRGAAAGRRMTSSIPYSSE